MTSSYKDTPSSVSVLIVGAGLSGLTAGRLLYDAGVDVLVLDKSRGVGGRCSTRRFQDHKFDHGAQFFTVQDPFFAHFVNKWLDSGLIREWSSNFPGKDGAAGRDGHPCYCAADGMNAIPKALASDLPVQTNTRVVKAQLVDKEWNVESECGKTIRAEKLILTAPMNQSMLLLSEDVRADLTEQHPNLLEVMYEACFAVLLILEGSSGIPYPGGVRVDGQDIAWIADNAMKGLRSGASALTIHTTHGFAREYIESSHEEIAERVIAASHRWLNSSVVHWQVHRWLFSKPISFVGAPCIALGKPPYLVLCGDYMQPPARIEGAVLSGAGGAEAILLESDSLMKI